MQGVSLGGSRSAAHLSTPFSGDWVGFLKVGGSEAQASACGPALSLLKPPSGFSTPSKVYTQNRVYRT